VPSAQSRPGRHSRCAAMPLSTPSHPDTETKKSLPSSPTRATRVASDAAQDAPGNVETVKTFDIDVPPLEPVKTGTSEYYSVRGARRFGHRTDSATSRTKSWYANAGRTGPATSGQAGQQGSQAAAAAATPAAAEGAGEAEK
jgi:hypothetical protein